MWGRLGGSTIPNAKVNTKAKPTPHENEVTQTDPLSTSLAQEGWEAEPGRAKRSKRKASFMKVQLDL